jgi:hypothetical protein
MTIPPAEETIREFAQDEGLNERETEQLVRALVVSRTRAEAIGEIAGQQAIANAGHVRDENFVVRYHGPDDMTHDADGNLREWEFKGNGENSLEVDEDLQGNKQGSAKKNMTRAEKMTIDKVKKIGWPSMRQGGPYTKGEINILWQGIIDRDGIKKEHYSVHANTKTGTYSVCERRPDGKIKKTEYNIPIRNFANKKLIIEKLFP